MVGLPRIRAATAADAPAIARVHVDSWRTAYRNIVPAAFLDAMSYEDFERRWRGWLEEAPEGGRSLVYVAESPWGIVGFAFGGPRGGEAPRGYEAGLYAIYLLEGHRRAGTGRRLLGAVARGLAAGGFASMVLWVLALDEPARRFYERMGGEPIGEREEEIGGAVLGEVAYGWADLRSRV